MTKSFFKDQRGQISFYLYFVITAVVLLFVFAFIVPFLMTMNTATFRASENLLEMGREQANLIQDGNVRTPLLLVFDDSVDAVVTNVQALGSFFQYTWALVIIGLLLVVFLFTRQNVERIEV